MLVPGLHEVLLFRDTKYINKYAWTPCDGQHLVCIKREQENVENRFAIAFIDERDGPQP